MSAAVGGRARRRKPGPPWGSDLARRSSAFSCFSCLISVGSSSVVIPGLGPGVDLGLADQFAQCLGCPDARLLRHRADRRQSERYSGRTCATIQTACLRSCGGWLLDRRPTTPSFSEGVEPPETPGTVHTDPPSPSAAGWQSTRTLAGLARDLLKLRRHRGGPPAVRVFGVWQRPN